LAGDYVRLNDIVLFAHLGVSEAEREVGQRIHLDLELRCDLEPAARSDRLAATVDYEAVYGTVQEVVEGRRDRLLESVAGAIVTALLDRYPVSGVRLRIRKPNVPFTGSLASAEVEMARER